MVQCKDGRRRQARIHGIHREEGSYLIWKAGVRLKGKHISGEAWYSHQTKTWHFISDPDAKHSHLMDQISDTLKEERIRKLHEQIKILDSRYYVEQKKVFEHRKAMMEIESEMETLKDNIAKLEKGLPLESEKPLEYSRAIKRI